LKDGLKIKGKPISQSTYLLELAARLQTKQIFDSKLYALGLFSSWISTRLSFHPSLAGWRFL